MEDSKISARVLAWPKQKNKSRNPFQYFLYKSIEKNNSYRVDEFSPVNIFSLFKAKVLHIHWPDAFLAADKGVRFWFRYFLIRLIFFVAKFSGTKIIWTAHNLQREGQRNAFLLDKYFWPWFLKRIDGIIFMTNASRDSALEQYSFLRDRAITVIPHGHYGELVKKCIRPDKQKTLIPSILFFGSITPYKNAHKLLAAFLKLPFGSAKLNIKGKMSISEPDDTLKAMLSDLPSERSKEVVFEDGFLSEEELVTEILKCDLVVFPYTDVLNSGAAIFALSVGRPILASNTSLFQELKELVGSKWVYLIHDELSEIDLTRSLAKAKALRKSGDNPDLSKFEWDVIAQQTEAFYTAVIGRDKS